MISIQDMLTILSGQLDRKRFQHSINVMESAERLAVRYGADPDKAVVAGLLHDCGKHISGSRLDELMMDARYEPDEIERAHPKLLHGRCGAVLAQRHYGVMDEEVLDAIRWHTTGCAGMSTLAKIVFVADYIGEDRDFDEVEELRAIAWKDLDLAVARCAEVTIAHVVANGSLLHPNTIHTRNEILLRERKAK